MSKFKKGDRVRSDWSAEQTVEAISPDGESLWLMDDGGDYATYNASSWTVIPKFFQAGKRYRSKSGSLVHIHHVTVTLNGKPVALAENVNNGYTFTLSPEHTDAYDL